jgi:molybdopterin-guanine dinucleotide biosynthesis protein A
MTNEDAIPPTIGAILAGGLARRLGGGDKALRTVGDRTVLAWLIDRLAPQVARLILNANADPGRFGALGLPVVADSLPDFQGPLAGVLAALDWSAGSAPGIEWVVTVPGDTPFIPHDLVTRLHAGRQRSNAIMACAASQDRAHPVIGLWPVSVRDDMRSALTEHGVRRIDGFMQRYACAVVDWPAAPVDPFFNVNTPDDLAEANRLVRSHPGCDL